MSFTASTVSLVPDPDTVNVRREATFLQRAQRVWGVNEFVKPLRYHPRVQNMAIKEDAANFNALVRTNAVLLFHLHRCAEDPAFAAAFLLVDGPNRVRSQIRNFSNIGRLSFAAMGNFFIENMLRDLVSDFGAQPKKKFHDLSKQAVVLASLQSPNEHVDALRVVSMLRNTFHSRGVHAGYKGQAQTLNLRGVMYDFKHNKIVRGHASWDYISHGFACALQTVLEIVEVSAEAPGR